MNALFSWAGTVVGQYGSKLSRLVGGAWSDFSGSFEPPDSALMRMKFAVAVQRLYLTASDGLKRVLATTSNPTAAGVPVGAFDYHNSRPSTLTGGFLAVDRCVAYRHLFKLTDSNAREIVGPVSDRVTVVNPPAMTIAAGQLSRGISATSVSATGGAPHLFKMGDHPSLSPGEANFAAGEKSLTEVFSDTTVFYTEAGGPFTTNAVIQTLSYGTSQVTLRITLPDGLTVDHVVQVYRSEVAPAATSTPGEEMYLVYEARLTATDISAGYLDVLDNTPDVLLGPTGYFSPSRDGIDGNHVAPLLAKEVATSGSVLLAANLRDKHRLEIDLIALDPTATPGGSQGGLAQADIITFRRGSAVFQIIFSTLADPAFAAFTGKSNYLYSPSSVAKGIERTALSLVSVINAMPDNTFLDASYVSGVDDAPGRILLAARDFTTTQFTVDCERSKAWNPELLLDGSTYSARSTQAITPGRVAWSLPDQPDAFPSLQFQDVGLGDEAVLRVIPLRDQTLIIKERSLWMQSGAWPNFRFDLLDDTVRVIAPDTATVHGGQVYALTAQGVAQISDGGVGLVSLPCDEDFLALLGAPFSVAKVLSWGCSRESEHQYLLGVPEDSLDVTATTVWCWNSLSKQWTKWPIARTCAAVESVSDLLYLGDGHPGRTRRERKAYDNSDAVEEAFGAAFLAYLPDNAEPKQLFMLDVTGIEVGDYIEDSAGKRARITRVDAAFGPLIFSEDGPATAPAVWVDTLEDWTGYIDNAAVTIHKAIPHLIERLPQSMGAAASGKQAQATVLHFRRECFQASVVSLASDISPAFVAAKTLQRSGWGLFEWGSKPFGTPGGPRNERALVPADQQRAAYFGVRYAIQEAFSAWQLQGLTLVYEAGSERTKR